MYSRTNIIYLFLVLSVITLFVTTQVQTTYGDVIPKSHFEIVNWLGLSILAITLLPVTRNYILRA